MAWFNKKPAAKRAPKEILTGEQLVVKSAPVGPPKVLPTASVYGRVINANTKEAVVNATVHLGGNTTLSSAPNGDYSFTGISPGMYRLYSSDPMSPVAILILGAGTYNRDILVYG